MDLFGLFAFQDHKRHMTKYSPKVYVLNRDIKWLFPEKISELHVLVSSLMVKSYTDSKSEQTSSLKIKY